MNLYISISLKTILKWKLHFNITVDMQTNLLTYANNIHTYEGGTHEDGFKRALTRVLNSYGTQSKIIKEDKDRLSGEDTREGLTAVVSIKHGDPQFEGQTKQN